MEARITHQPVTVPGAGKQVLISIASTQIGENNEESSTEFFTEGKLDVAKDGIVLTYRDSDVTGMGDTVTEFTVRPDEVVLERRGSVRSRMIFRTGEDNDFCYETPVGMLMLGLRTRSMEQGLSEKGGRLHIEYELNFERSFLSRNRIQLDVKESEGKET